MAFNLCQHHQRECPQIQQQPVRPPTGSSRAWAGRFTPRHRLWTAAVGLCLLLCWGAIVPLGAAEPQPEPGPTDESIADPAPPAEEQASEVNRDTLFYEWMDSQHELGQGEFECVMCAGFGGAVVCGIGCDATGLTIRKPNGSVTRWCGVCTDGTWQK